MSQQPPYRNFGAPQHNGFGGPQFGSNPQFGGAPQGYPGPPGAAGRPQFGGPPPRPRSRTSPGVIVLTAVACLGLIAGLVLITNALLSKGNDVAYSNENYSPPPVETAPEEIPIPSTEAELSTMLYDNPINAQTVSAPIRCEVEPVAAQDVSSAEAEAHFNALTGCLMTTWVEPMTNAGWTLYRPQVTVYEGAVDTPCGELPEMNAVYCPGNQQLYFSKDLAELPPLSGNVGNPTAFDLTIAHEFGHSLQGRSGQLAAAVILADGLSEDEALKISRLREAQADCYAGLFVNSAAQSVPYDPDDASNFLEMSFNMGSDQLSGDPGILTTHPRGDTREYWTQVGMSTAEIGKCNTYVVSDDELTN